MRSLFLKIFLWFWAAMVLIGLALFLVVTTTQPDPLPLPWRESTGEALDAYAATAIDAWEKNGRPALISYLTEQQARTRSQLRLFDDTDRELSGLPLEPLLNGGPDGPPNRLPDGPPNGPPNDGLLPRLRREPPPLEETWRDIRRRTLRGEEAVFELAGPRVLAARRVTSPSGRNYVLQATLPRPRFGRPAADARTQLLGVLVVLAMSGLVCYGLVRYLTAPLVSLRAATRQLAAGDLAARTGAATRARRDEVADLGRDFDAMAERIEALVTAQRRLLGDISHELRSPLARLSMSLALTRRHVAEGASVDELNHTLDRIKRETGRLNALIEQLLQLARLESGDAGTQAGVPAAAVEVEALLHEIVADADFEARGASKKVLLTASQPCIVNGSRDLLRSAIENVVRNALRYTAPETAVEVTLRRDHNEVVIQVRDHGDGVPEAALSQLFRPFYRVADARDRESGGVGLGLAITERAVLSHGGTVAARNAEDGGLLVELRLPFA